MYSSKTEGAALIQEAVCTKVRDFEIQIQSAQKVWSLCSNPLSTCLKSGIGSSSSSLVKNSQTKVSSAVSKSGPYSTGNTFCRAKRESFTHSE